MEFKRQLQIAIIIAFFLGLTVFTGLIIYAIGKDISFIKSNNEITFFSELSFMKSPKKSNANDLNYVYPQKVAGITHEISQQDLQYETYTIPQDYTVSTGSSKVSPFPTPELDDIDKLEIPVLSYEANIVKTETSDSFPEVENKQPGENYNYLIDKKYGVDKQILAIICAEDCPASELIPTDLIIITAVDTDFYYKITDISQNNNFDVQKLSESTGKKLYFVITSDGKTVVVTSELV